MKLNKKVSLGVVAVLAAASLTACNDTPQTDANTTEAQQAAAGQTPLLRDQPIPVFQYSQIRQNLIEIETAQANGAVSTTFFLHMGSPDPYLVCPSIGSPIPATAQLTNPSQAVGNTGGSSAYAMTSIGQMENTGIYTGDSTGTYIMCVGKDGSVNPVYWEGYVMTAFGPASWDKATHTMSIDGPSGSKFTGLKK